MLFQAYLALPSLVSCRSPLAVTADKAYVSEKVRQRIKNEGVLHPQTQQYRKESLLSEALLPGRHIIENYFCRIEDFANPLRHRQKLPCRNHRRRLLYKIQL